MDRICKFGGSRPRQDRRALRREEAKSRLELWRSLSLLARIAALDVQLGAGKGAKRQRARLAQDLRAGK